MDLHITVDRRGKGLARRIAAELRTAVRTGRLRPGTRLPASRQLAHDLEVSRGVVVEAYEQLVAEGIFTARQGDGTRVARPPEPRSGGAAQDIDPDHPAPRFDLRVGKPDLTAFPRRAWLSAARAVMADLPHTALDYPDPRGAPRLRHELAGYLARVRAADITADRIAIVGGVAHGLSLVVSAMGGLRLAVEDPTSPRQIPLLEAAGAVVIPVPVDGEGMDVDALARTDADAVLLTPAHQYPTGVVLSARRRWALRDWLADRDALAIEDDYDAEFRYDRDPVGCVQGLLPQRSILLGTVSKTLAPALRLGWLAGPARVVEAVGRLRSQSDLGSPVLDQHILAHLIASGEYERHVRTMRRAYRRRRDTLVDALARHLPQATIAGVSAGQHLYIELPDGNESAIVARAAELGVGVHGAAGYRLAKPGPTAFVLGFAGLTPARLTEAIRILAVAARSAA